MDYDGIIFDLDGTLWNASSSSAHGWNIGFKSLGIKVPEISSKEIESVAGRTFEDCVKGVYPDFNMTKYPNLLVDINKYEKEAVKSRGGVIYDGVISGLQKLSQKYKLFLVSNCQKWYLDYFLSYSKLETIFFDQECYGRTKKPKSENITLVVNRNNLRKPIYVGDTLTDANSALEAKVDFLHAAYGFGKSRKDWQRVNSFNELVIYFLGN